MSQPTQPVYLRVICLKLPPNEMDGCPLEYGLQDKAGNLQKATARDDGAIIYTCEAKAAQNEHGTPNFLGSTVHGAVSERFLYLSVRLRGETNWRWRSKISLKDITWEMVEATQSGVLEITIEAMTPARPTIISGWQPKQ